MTRSYDVASRQNSVLILFRKLRENILCFLLEYSDILMIVCTLKKYRALYMVLIKVIKVIQVSFDVDVISRISSYAFEIRASCLSSIYRYAGFL